MRCFLESPGTSGAFFVPLLYRQIPNKAASAALVSWIERYRHSRLRKIKTPPRSDIYRGGVLNRSEMEARWRRPTPLTPRYAVTDQICDFWAVVVPSAPSAVLPFWASSDSFIARAHGK